MRKRRINRTVKPDSLAGVSKRRSGGFDRRTRQFESDPPVTAAIAERQPDPSYPEGLATLADVFVLQMFDSGLGETLRMAYTMLQSHQERQNRRAARSAAADALRDQLAQLDDGTDV